MSYAIHNLLNYYLILKFILLDLEAGGTFDLKLHNPDYAILECSVPASIDGQKSIITCGINIFIFPLFEEGGYQFPTESEINSIITFENWDNYIGEKSLK